MHTLIQSLRFFGNNTSLMYDKTLAHLAISFASVGVAFLIAVPLGVWLGHLHRGSFLAINVSNIGRALPSLAVISLGIAFLGIGFVNTMVALVILAGPVMMTNAYVAVDQVDPNAVQAAKAMGMRPWQVLFRVELPLAISLIFAGIRTGTVYVIATATLATFAGGSGLGDVIVNEPSYGIPGVVAASLTITALAFVVDGLLAVAQQAITPQPLRHRGKATRIAATVTEPSWETAGLDVS